MSQYSTKEPQKTSKKHRVAQHIEQDDEKQTQSPTLDMNRMSPENVLQLQQTIGNQAVMRLLSTSTPAQSPTIQRLTVSELIAQHKKAQESAGKTQTSSRTPRSQSGLGSKQSKYFRALATHRRDRAALLKHVKRGAALGREQKIGKGKMSADAQKRLANSCEWILEGKTQLYALTPTGDSAERVAADGKDPADQVAYFPAGMDGSGTGAVTSSIAPYKYKDLTDNTNVEIDDDNTVGWNGAGFLAVTNPQQRTQDYVWETIRHEVQHDADQNRDKEGDAAVGWPKLLESYKTEYRAYSYEGSAYDNLDHDPGNLVDKYGYQWTERQLAIFEGVFEEYDHTSTGWGKTGDDPKTKTVVDNLPDGAIKTGLLAFQRAVVAYRNPDAEGFNKWNSVRVDDFYTALKAIPDATDEGEPNNFVLPLTATQTKVKMLMTVLDTLNREDAQYILNDSPDFTGLLATKLQNLTLARIQTLLGAVT
jgi:hypothetical protein